MGDRKPRSGAAGRVPPDEMILEALRRAVLHGPARTDGAPLRVILEHLAIPRRSARAKAIAQRVAALERSGEVIPERVHGVIVWALAPIATLRLATVARRGRLQALPESPQHRAWRGARLAACEELDRFAADLTADLAAAEAMLAAISRQAGAPHSDALFALGRRLLGDCRRLGSAWHCLNEWAEPDDARADRDEAPAAGQELRALRAGRRNIALWADRG